MTSTGSGGSDEAELAVNYAYPPHWEADVVVADGGLVHLRPITPDDSDAMVAFHAGLSDRTRYLRYFAPYPTIPARDLFRFTHVDHRDRVAIAVWAGGVIVAIGAFEAIAASGVPSGTAEVAFVVADAHQGRGIGSVLIEHLAEAAREVGLSRFEASVLTENTTMLRVFLDAGYAQRRQLDGSVVALEFDIAATEATEQVIAEREQRAESRSIRRVLFPGSVAVIGASHDPGKLGNVMLDNLLRSGFTGPLYPVNPAARSVNGILAYPSVSDVPTEVDLAVIAVPADAVPGVLEQCGTKGVQGVIVISGGFGESGDGNARQSGREAQRELVRRARDHGMRVVGPNCLGIMNTDPSISLNASLAVVSPVRGRAGFFCQSGALGAAVLGEAARRGLGVSTFVSAGNRADVSGNDLLQYWDTDPATEVALLYLESFGNPRKFARLARRFAKHKPIVAVKSGRGSVVAGLQHTTVEVPEPTVQTLFEASGVIRTQTLAELFDVAVLLTTQPLPAGDRIAVVGHSTALGVLAADALATEGLPMTRFVQVGTESDGGGLAGAVRDALAAEDVDAVVCIFVPTMRGGQDSEVAARLRAVVADQAKPVLSTFLGFDGVPAELAVPGDVAPMTGSIPSYSSPERAIAALAHVARYARWRRRDAGTVPDLSVDVDAARALVSAVLRRDPAGRHLDRSETARLLRCFGIELVARRLVSDESSAVRAATELGWPVALSAAGGLRLQLGDPDDLAVAWRSLAPGAGAVAHVQPMVTRGINTMLRVHDDRSFGSLVTFGVGGVATDLLDDRAYAVVPLTDVDADEFIRSPRAFPLLTGYGGAEPADVPALVDLALRLSQLADEVPEVVECALEPIVAAPDGAHVLDARIRLAPPLAHHDLGARRMSGL